MKRAWSALLLLAIPAGLHGEDMTFKVESNLKAAAAKVDITPPADTKVVGHVRPTSGVRAPLHARILILATPTRRPSSSPPTC